METKTEPRDDIKNSLFPTTLQIPLPNLQISYPPPQLDRFPHSNAMSVARATTNSGNPPSSTILPTMQKEKEMKKRKVKTEEDEFEFPRMPNPSKSLLHAKGRDAAVFSAEGLDTEVSGKMTLEKAGSTGSPISQTLPPVPSADHSFHPLPPIHLSPIQNFPNVSNMQESPKRKVENDYNINGKIGKGRYGDVYRASSKRTNEEFAIKKAKNGPIPSIERQILKEMQFSPYFCQFIEEYEDGIVMELCSRDTLSDERKKHGSGYFGPQLGALKGIEIVRALQDLHASGYIHRDIKPSNFLIPSTVKMNTTWNNHLFL